MTRHWSDFPVAFPPSADRFNNACSGFKRVTHVAHTADAIRIIEDARIRSSLVYDESCLNTKRTQVSWVSPKTWSDGYLYGNVAFAFDWSDLVARKSVYWVEHRTTGRQEICRFLICEGTFADHGLEEYDYSRPHGPLYYDKPSGEWYHNDNVTSEYMVLSDLAMDSCIGIRFVNHHPRYCNKRRLGCPELERTARDAGAEVLCKLVGSGQTKFAKLFACAREPDQVEFSVQGAVDLAYRRIVGAFNAEGRSGTLPPDDQEEVMRAILLAFGWAQKGEVSTLLALFPSQESVERAYVNCVSRFFGDLKVNWD